MAVCSIQLAKAGDWVVIDYVLEGEIVFSSVTDSYANDFRKSEWPPNTYCGLMVREKSGALYFYPAESFTGDHPTSIAWAATKTDLE